MLYASIVSFQFHPGNKVRLSAEECLRIALSYWEALWPG